MGGYIGGNGGVTQVDGYSKTEVDSKVSDKVEDSQVLTDVPANAVFTDTTYSIQDGELSQNNFTNADHTKLDGIETAATADQTKSDIEGLGIDVPATNLTGTIPAARLSTATTQAESDDSTKIATTAYVVDKITTLIGGAPSTLNDLNELAAAINDDANYNSTLTTALATKLPLAGGTMTGNLSFGDGHTLALGDSSEFTIRHTSGGNTNISESGSGNLNISARDLFIQDIAGTNRLKVDGNLGDISFYEDTGTTAKFFWDASAESLGIGTSSPDQSLVVADATGVTTVAINNLRSNVGDVSSINFRHNSITGSQIKSEALEDFSVSANRTSDLQFWTRNNGTILEAMRIDSSGNVGIGTSSPASTLDISHTDAIPLRLSRSTSGQTAIRLTNGSANNLDLTNDGSGNFTINNGGAERMRIDSSGRVGIGTTSPSAKLEVAGNVKLGAVNPMQTATNVVHGTSGQNGFNIRTAVSGATTPTYSNVDDPNTGMFFPVADTLGITTGGTERMRINSSGNLLVGTTSTGAATASNGAYITPSGQIIGRSDGIVSYLNRRSTDGQILQFMKDGAHVGSIGVASGDNLYIAGGSGNTKGLYFNDSGVVPANTGGAPQDNASDLGAPSVRFKDGYFAGNLYGDGSNLTGVGGSTTAGAVGTYAWAAFGTFGTGGIIDFGDTKAGSNLYPVSLGYDGHTGNSVAGSFLGGDHGALSGTWRFLGDAKSPAYNRMPAGLWLRIS